MSKSTPGPWTHDSHGGCFYVWGPGQRMVADGDPGGDDDAQGYVARMRGVGRGASVGEQEANARLIAAAPEMLASLRVAADSFRDARIALLKIGELTGNEKAMACMAAGCDVSEQSTRDLIARVEGRR